jgi:hypothetical protein
MKRALRSSLLGLALVAGAAGAAGSDDPQIVSSRAFIDAHPDLRLRQSGEQAYHSHQYRSAFSYFKDAARYADKTSQAMVAEMLWKGEGTTQDKSLAYAWMDLAAERGYTGLIALRERYWADLSEAERKRAVDVGQSVYAEYGDEVAKPRMERELARARLQITGSRVGHVGTLKIPGAIHIGKGASLEGTQVNSGDFYRQVDGTRYYADNYWDPKEYWHWQDVRWAQAEGRVDVGAPVTTGK